MAVHTQTSAAASRHGALGALHNAAAHYYLAWSTAGLFVPHVAAALKHHFRNRDRVLGMRRRAARSSAPAPA
jgi:cytochrome b561